MFRRCVEGVASAAVSTAFNRPVSKSVVRVATSAVAAVLALLLGSSPLALSDDQQEELALFLAQRRDTLSHLLKGGALSELERKDPASEKSPD